MLTTPEYLGGLAQLVLMIGFAGLGAARLRARLLPGWSGPPGWLATSVLAVSLLVLTAEALGTVGMFRPLPYLACLAAAGIALRLALAGDGETRAIAAGGQLPAIGWTGGGGRRGLVASRFPAAGGAGATRWRQVVAALCLLLAAVVLVRFGIATASAYGTGMTGFDTTWYHGPFTALMAGSGSTLDLNPIAPQYLSWFYPQNSEVLHAVGVHAFGRDLVSPGLNLVWLLGCMTACWSIGRPYGLAPLSLAAGSLLLGTGLVMEQAGEARNDLPAIFFIAAAIAVLVNSRLGRGRSGDLGAHAAEPAPDPDVERAVPDVVGPAPDAGGVGRALDAARPEDVGPDARVAGREGASGLLIVIGLAAGLAAGTKLNYLAGAGALVIAASLLMPPGRRLRGFGVLFAAVFAAGGYWYVRNAVHAGNPLPWITSAGPLSLPGPSQEIGGRESHGVVEYLFDGSIWTESFFPGLRDALTAMWPVLIAAGLASTLMLLGMRWTRRHGDHMLAPSQGRAVAFVLLAMVGAWLVAPASAEGPAGDPVGFESGLRYLAPAILLALVLLPVALARWVTGRRGRVATPAAGAEAPPATPGAEALPARRGPEATPGFEAAAAGSDAGHTGEWLRRGRRWRGPAVVLAAFAVLALLTAGGDRLQRHYLESRYAEPDFATPGLAAAFEWAREGESTSIATTATRQYPLFGTDLSNRVEFVGVERPHGGYVRPVGCEEWQRAVNRIAPAFVLTAWDRIDPGQPPLPPEAGWARNDPATGDVLRAPGAAVFSLAAPLDPRRCP